jgi:RNase P subunit RPR2
MKLIPGHCYADPYGSLYRIEKNDDNFVLYKCETGAEIRRYTKEVENELERNNGYEVK